MVGTIFTFFVIGVIALLSAHEVLRYKAAQRGSAEIHCTRASLSRRLGAAALVVGSVLTINYWPQNQTLAFNCVLLAAVCLSLFLIFALTIKELHDTSVAVVREHDRLFQEAQREIEAERAEGSRPLSVSRKGGDGRGASRQS